jgi:protein arginine N-methyltransferase 5
MARQTDDRKVWYEWMVEVFALERIVDASATELPAMSGAREVSPAADCASGKDNGTDKPQKAGKHSGFRRVRVGMSDLHSSIKEGCLM